MKILTHWRVTNWSCKLCKKIICDCSSGCRCTAQAIARHYESLWITDSSPSEDLPTTKTIDVLMSEIQSLPKLGHMLWKELHELPLHIKHVWWVYDATTVEEINEYLRWFKVKLTCWDCREHFTALVINNPFTWTTPRELREYINWAHNSVNERLWRKTFNTSEAIVRIAQDLKKLWYVRWLDIYDYNWWFNFK